MTSGSWKALVGMLVLTMGTSTITPLLPLYKQDFGISTGTATLLFVTYTITVCPTMLIAGNLSDRLGRKRLLLPALVLMTLASLVFALAESVPMLFAGRVLQGLAIGGFLGVGAAFVVDHANADRKALAAALAGVFFRLGFGLGPGLAGIAAEYAASPRHTPFWGHIALMVVGIVAVSTAAETLMRRPDPGPFRIRIGVPSGQALGFLTYVAPATFLMSFIEGTVLSVVPIFVVDTLGVQNLAVVGAIGFLVLAVGGVAPFVARGLDPRRAVMTGVALSSLLSLLIVTSSGLDTVVLVVLAAAAIGFTNGFILYGGTVICGTIVPIEERGKLMSLLYMCAYAGTIPTIALGYLGDAIGLTRSLAIFSGVALVLACFVLLVGRRLFREVVPYREPAPVAAEAAVAPRPT
ncbi:MFS transporter [Miltoncostaea marina]|uniref:MFS transporter n=1 Tax=Miltoncostaea marina TaxID=2843215 RepID=UPI001C3CBDA8|nr:MFS transporter [Miltoncostaea marina]